MAPRCPLDQTTMDVTAAEGHVGYRCPRCAGLWLPAAYLAALAHDRDFDVEAFHARLAADIAGAAAFACPAGHLLSRVDYRTLELDWCATCRGVWFDAGELRRLLDLHPNVFTEGAGMTAAAAAGSMGVDLAIALFLFS